MFGDGKRGTDTSTDVRIKSQVKINPLKGEIIRVLCPILFLLILIPSAVANFACGEVTSNANVSAAWFPIKLTYTDNPDFSTYCSVSPEDNKYCCDPEQIEQVSWQVGKQVQAVIPITGDGYFSDPVTLTITGEGFDVFPQMTLQRAIAINAGPVILDSQQKNLEVAVSSGIKDLVATISQDGRTTHEQSICDSCEIASIKLPESDILTYDITLSGTLKNSGETFNETHQVINKNKITVERKFSCKGCSEGYIPANSEVTMSETVTTPVPIATVIQEVIPKSWTVVSGGDAQEFSKTHNQMLWEFHGTSLEKIYTIKTPDAILPQTFTLATYLNGVTISSQDTRVYKFIKTSFLAQKHELSETVQDVIADATFNVVSPTRPLVLTPDSNILNLVAIFPKEDSSNSLARITVSEKKEDKYQFSITTTIPSEKIDRVLIRFRQPISTIVESNVSLSFQEKDIPIKQIKEDEEYNYYESLATYPGEYTISIEKTKKSFWRSIFP